MAKPFALAPHLIFLFLLPPIPSSCSQPHSVLQWVDLGDDFDDFVFTMMTVIVTMFNLGDDFEMLLALLSLMIQRHDGNGIQACHNS